MGDRETESVTAAVRGPLCADMLPNAPKLMRRQAERMQTGGFGTSSSTLRVRVTTLRVRGLPLYVRERSPAVRESPIPMRHLFHTGARGKFTGARAVYT